MIKTFLKLFLVLFSFLNPIGNFVSAEPHSIFPSLNAETLSGKAFRIPEDFGGKPVFLVIGFTKSSRESTTRCDTNLRKSLPIAGYQIAILQGAPFFLKGVIKNAIRSSVLESLRPFFLVLNEGKSDLAALLGFQKHHEDDAYIAGLKPKNGPQYETTVLSHGACDESHLKRVLKDLKTLEN